jgi:hypothetical protein
VSEKSKVFLYSSVSVWGVLLLLSLLVNLSFGVVVHISLASPNELASQFIKILEVVRGKSNLVGFVTKPFHAVSDVVNEVLVFLHWVGVVVS